MSTRTEHSFAPCTAGTSSPGAVAGLVSIVVPCYKGARYVADAIDSCLSQSYSHIEVIVVDDASPDDCHAIASRYAQADPRVRVLRHEKNGGVARAFNTGFHNAQGAFHTRLAQDDRLKPDAVGRMVRQLQEVPSAGLVYADMETIDDSGRVQSDVRLPSADAALTWGNGLGVCVMWRKSVWASVGEFDPTFDAAEDFDYWVRVAERFEITKVSAPLLQFRVHEAMGSIVHTRKQERASLAVRRRQVRRAPLFSARRWGNVRSLSHHYYSFSYDHSVTGDHWGALGRILLSVLYWPLPYPRARVRSSFARVRLSSMIIWRLLRSVLRRPRDHARAPQNHAVPL